MLETPAYLERNFSIKDKCGHLLSPVCPLVCLIVQVVVKDGPLRGELDVLELRHPPLGELNSVVHKLGRG